MIEKVKVTVCQTGEVREVDVATMAIIIGMDAREDADRIVKVPFLDTDRVERMDDEYETEDGVKYTVPSAAICAVDDTLIEACEAFTSFDGTVADWRQADATRVAYVAFDIGEDRTRWQACRLTGETK